MVNIGREIELRLKERSLPVSWLACEISCSRANVYKILKKESIDTDLLMRISKAMDFDFFSMYSSVLMGGGIVRQCRRVIEKNNECEIDI